LRAPRRAKEALSRIAADPELDDGPDQPIADDTPDLAADEAH
jgi:hypothetical protein